MTKQPDLDTYDLTAKIAFIKSLGQKTLSDGLRMVRLIGPNLRADFNDQIGVAECQTPEQLVCESNRGSKSFTAACKFAAIARDVPLTTWDGRQIDCRLPQHRGVPMTLWCHDDQTEVLTNSGWRLFSELSGDELLATVNLQSDTLEFQKPTRIVKGKYAGDMIRFHGAQKLDMLVTPEHRMVVYPDPLGKEYAGERVACIKQAQDLCHKDRLKATAANWVGVWPNTSLPDFLLGVDIPAFAEWLGFYIAEGCCHQSAHDPDGRFGWKVEITQKKPDGVAYYLELAARLPFKFHREESRGGFIICSKALWQYLDPLGDKYSKYVPQWVKDAPQEVIRAFLRGYFMGDGHTDPKRGTSSACSASRRLIDDIQELLLKVGLSGAIKVRPPSRYEFKQEGRSGMRGELYTIKVWTRDRISVRCHGGGEKRGLLFNRESGYDSYVYCATVPNGTLVTRRNGKPVVSGNCIGLQLNHIGDTMFRLLFEEGQFKMIMDPKSLAWRAFRPWEKWDADNADQTKPAPPLIPPHEIDQDSWVWENKGARQVAKVSLLNGTRFHFYPSTGDVKKGDPVHGIWIDELIRYSEHYPEWIMRLTDYEGFLLWSTMIYRNVSALNALMDDAQKQKEEFDRGERPASRVTATMFKFKQGGNPYLKQSRVETNREILERFGDDEIKMRIDGGSIFDSTLIYPYFDKKIHAAIPEGQAPDQPNKEWDALALVLHDLAGLPPADWTHELIIDPGAQKPAVLFCAVPPPEWRDARGREWRLWGAHAKPFFVPYDEIYGQRYSLDQLVPLIKQKMRGIRFRRFIIDMQAARQTPLVGGPPVKALFSAKFEEHGLESEETGINFIAGDNNFQSRSRLVDGWMQTLQSGKPQLRVVTKRCPNLVWQLAHNQRRMIGEVVVDEEEKRERNDLRVCLEYYASRKPVFVPVSQQGVEPWVNKQRRTIEELFGRTVEESTRCHFGPGLAPRGAA